MRIIIISLLAFVAACGRGTGGTTGQQQSPDGAAADAASAQENSASAGQRGQTDAAPQEQRWFIAAANPYAAEAGAAILRKGGSAVDAAVATQAVLGLVEPQSSGLGGGAFMLHYQAANGRLETYDGRETAPASAAPDRFLLENGQPMEFYDAVAGGLSIGVPGAVRMLELAHADHGRLDWAELFDGAIALSENGFEVSPRLNSFMSRIPRLRQTPVAAAYFYDETGAPLPVGHLLKNPEYAKTLRTIAAGGGDAFYTGDVARAIVEAVNEAPNPGGMTLDDLAGYEAVKRDPVCSLYRQLQICSMAPPSSGGVTTLQILSLLEKFDMAQAGAHSVKALHLIFEASRLAYADRNRFLADNDMLAEAGGLTAENVISGLLNPEYLSARAQLIDTGKALAEIAPGDPSQFLANPDAGKWRPFGADASPEPPSTSHFVIMDGAGNVVSMTTTVEFPFGSHQMAAGMILNNQLTDFSFLPDRDGVPVANAVAPNKRPRSSMSPVIIFNENGGVWGALGSPGGPAIIGYVVKTLIAMIDWEMPAQDAINLPNAVYPRDEAIVEEGGVDANTIAALRALGHRVAERGLTSGVHAFRIMPDGSFDGGADPRREGVWLSGFVEDGAAE